MAQVSQSLWQFIPIDQYSRPADPTTEVVRKGIRGVWDRFLERSRSDEKSVMAQDDLHYLSRELLETVAPSPAWDSAVSVMTDALTDWLKSPAPTLQVLVGPPFSGLSEIASHWAYANEWRVLTPPQPAEVLRGADEWFAELERHDDTSLVIPSLECYYLRHHDGLALARRLIDWLHAKQIRCLIGCDSWAWAFFRKALEVDVLFAPPLTLQGFDYDHLQQWFRLLSSAAQSPTFDFLQANNAEPVLKLANTWSQPDAEKREQPQTQKDESETKVTDFLKCLAGCSRGNLGVALAIWRCSLQLATHAKAQEVEEARDTRVLWVKPWPQIDLPSCPTQCTQSDLFVLHALLLHGGLRTDMLPQVLPSSSTEIMHSLHELLNRGILEKADEKWRVTALGYPAARQALRSEGYLIDQF